MNYTQKSFSVRLGSEAYRDNFDRIFRSKCSTCGKELASGVGLSNAHAAVCDWTCAGNWNEQHSNNFAFGPRR